MSEIEAREQNVAEFVQRPEHQAAKLWKTVDDILQNTPSGLFREVSDGETTYLLTPTADYRPPSSSDGAKAPKKEKKDATPEPLHVSLAAIKDTTTKSKHPQIAKGSPYFLVFDDVVQGSLLQIDSFGTTDRVLLKGEPTNISSEEVGGIVKSIGWVNEKAKWIYDKEQQSKRNWSLFRRIGGSVLAVGIGVGAGIAVHLYENSVDTANAEAARVAAYDATPVQLPGESLLAGNTMFVTSAPAYLEGMPEYTGTFSVHPREVSIKSGTCQVIGAASLTQKVKLVTDAPIDKVMAGEAEDGTIEVCVIDASTTSSSQDTYKLGVQVQQ